MRVARIFNTFGPRMHMNDGKIGTALVFVLFDLACFEASIALALTHQSVVCS